MPTKNKLNLKKSGSPLLAILSKINQAKKVLFGKILIYKSSKTTYLIILGIGLLIFVVVKRNWFIAASVNNSPISNIELQQRLNDQYRSQVLNRMITEKIILDEAKKNAVIVRSNEIDKRFNDVANSFGGVTALEGLLAQDGQTVDGFKNQVKLQLVVEKLYEKEATISAEELNQFLTQSKDQLQSTDSAEQTKEALDILKQQKISKIFNDKFPQLKSAAQIKIF